jgi:hypothetical protein
LRRLVTGGLAAVAALAAFALAASGAGAPKPSKGTYGVGHYGLFADLIGEMEQHGGRPRVLTLFRSAEAYVRMWERAYAR